MCNILNLQAFKTIRLHNSEYKSGVYGAVGEVTQASSTSLPHCLQI
jgi:hypothetical protein